MLSEPVQAERPVVEFVAPSKVVDALDAALRWSKQGNVMTHVYVVGPSGAAAASLMNELARRGGVVNTSFVTLDHLARELTQGLNLLPRMRGSMRRELVRRVASEARAPLSKYETSILAKSLNPVFDDLMHRPSAEIDRIFESSALNAEIVRLYRQFLARMEGRYSDASDTFRSAESAVRAGARGCKVVALIQEPPDSGATKLYEALADTGQLTIVATKCGIASLDQALETALWGLTHETQGEVGVAVADKVCVVPDADIEVQVALQELLRLAESGVPFSQMAILYTSTSPYAQIVEDQLQMARVPSRGRNALHLNHTLTGGFIARLFDVLDTEFAFDSVSAWLLSIPGLKEAPHWLRVARSARVIGDASTWIRRLESYSQRPPSARQSEAEIQYAAEFAEFIREFTVWNETKSSTWSGWVEWTQKAIERYLGGHTARRDWDAAEGLSAVRIEELLGDLAVLDELGEDVSRETFMSSLREELETYSAKGVSRRTGVFVGTIGDAIGCVFDAVVVCGMAEALYPGANKAKGLLASITVPGEESQNERNRRAFSLRLAGTGRRVVTVPRADARSQRAMRPSQLVTDMASVITSRPVSGEELLRPHEDWEWLDVARSFTELIRRDALQATVQFDQVALLDSVVRAGEDPVDAEVVANLDEYRLGVSMIRERDGSSMSRFDGLVGEPVSFGGEESAPVAPTTLERWATCPFQYLLEHVLHVEPTEDEPALLTMDKRDKGQLVHSVLEAFINAVDARSNPSQKWSDSERTLLHEIVDREFDVAVRDGVAPEGFAADVERKTVHQHMDVLLDKDELIREERGVVPVAAERRFGSGGESVAVALSNEQPVWLRGRIDRIDASPDGTQFVVTDYKTGSSRYAASTKDDPVAGGKSLQLAVYSKAVEALYPEARNVQADNWYVLDNTDYYARKGIAFDADAKTRLHEVFDLIAESFSSGAFPAVSGEDDGRSSFKNCRTCAYDGLCPADRAEAWARKSEDSAVRAYVTLGKTTERGS